MSTIIVSGCPRSGTSMCMRILDMAGLEIAKDDQREPDKDNIHGYFEIDRIINRIKDDPDMIKRFDGQVVKVIHYGLEYLPRGDYKIIYIERDIEEVLDSMEKMMGAKDPKRDETREAFLAFAQKVKRYMSERGDFQVLVISHRTLVTDPAPEIDRIIEFLDVDPSKKQDMINAIDRNSYRNKRR